MPARTDRAAIPETPARPEMLAFHGALFADAVSGAAASRDEIAGARMDRLRAAYAGPYTVDGASVSAPPMFRMNGGANDAASKAHQKELAAICAKAGFALPPSVPGGYCRPSDLVRVTQALIDAGKLPPPPPGDVATRVRRMQWEWGIGVDCAAYTRNALAAAAGVSDGALHLLPAGTESFHSTGSLAKSFKRVDPTLARPGDLITLDDDPPEPGHNVVVRSHRMEGTLHVYEVDSSWGAGPDGADYGGYRRDTWTYDDATKLWSWTNRHVSPPRTEVSLEGPAGERFHGCYRPKVGS